MFSYATHIWDDRVCHHNPVFIIVKFPTWAYRNFACFIWFWGCRCVIKSLGNFLIKHYTCFLWCLIKSEHLFLNIISARFVYTLFLQLLLTNFELRMSPEKRRLRVIIFLCRCSKIHENNFIRSFHNVPFAVQCLHIFYI